MMVLLLRLHTHTLTLTGTRTRTRSGQTLSASRPDMLRFTPRARAS